MKIGKKSNVNEIDITRLPQLRHANEFLRMWAQKDGPMTCLIDPA